MEQIFPHFNHIRRRNIAVVGAGIIGLSTAYAAAIQSAGTVKVTLYEAVETGHPDAASTDQSRVFRHLHGPDSKYTIWAKESGQRWDQISKSAGNDVLHRLGVLFLMHRRGDPNYVGGHIKPYNDPMEWMLDSLQVLDDQKVSYLRLKAGQLERQFPQFSPQVIEEAVLDQNAGMLEADLATSTLLRLCIEAGVKYQPDSRVTGVSTDNSSCIVELDGAKEVRHEAAVLAINGWTSDLLQLPKGTLSLNEQPMIYLEPPDGEHLFDQGTMPVFISLGNDCNGFPLHRGVIKVSDDNPYRSIDHPDQRNTMPSTEIARVKELVGGFIPLLKDAKVQRTHMCFYDRSKDGNFILDRWDNNNQIIYGCGMSGRAFKFAPVIGERLARFVITGDRPSDITDLQIR